MPSRSRGRSRRSALAAHPAPHCQSIKASPILARSANCLFSDCSSSPPDLSNTKMIRHGTRGATLYAACSFLLALCLLLLAACQPLSEVATASTPVAAVVVSDTSAAPPALATLSGILPEVAQITPMSDAEATVAALLPVQISPIHLAIAAAGLDAPVQPMQWERFGNAEGAATRWVLPVEAAGWHPDSARPGEAGTMVISGAQLDGGVFAPIALGDARSGQIVQLLDSAGVEHRYRIGEISAPIAIQGDPTADARIATYMAPTDQPRLLLITGWPDFTTTHRIFVVAEAEPE